MDGNRGRKSAGPKARLVFYRDRPIGIRWRLGARSGERSAETYDRDEAIGAKALLLRDLADGRIPAKESFGPAVTWSEFRERYRLEHVATLSEGSQSAWTTAANHLERLMKPRRLADVDKGMLSSLRGALLEEGKSPASVATYLRTIRASLGWAEEMDLIKAAPKVRTRSGVKRSTGMRSRPITLEELERIVAKVSSVRPKDPEPWRRFLWGLWHSSLRVDELRRLSWDAGADLSIDQSGKYPMIRMYAEGHKSRTDCFQPITPEFWALIDRPGVVRRGPVFPLPGRRGQMTRKAVIRAVSALGRAAGVVTDVATGKMATSHDIGRRACITRLSTKLSMAQTQQFARHADPRTTSQFYLKHEAEALAVAVGWAPDALQ